MAFIRNYDASGVGMVISASEGLPSASAEFNLVSSTDLGGSRYLEYYDDPWSSANFSIVANYGGSAPVMEAASFFDGGTRLLDIKNAFWTPDRMLSGFQSMLSGNDELVGNRYNDVLRGFNGNDILRGNAGADHLEGGAGVDDILGGTGGDKIYGGTGADRLAGGAGADAITGGLGNDTFQFNSRLEVGDLISDFANVSGNNDQFRISAAGFGGGLVAGGLLAASQFQSRGDNLAQDSNDRFIFRATDKTLWFDADGRGGAAAVLVADLQAGATVTAADIFVI